MERIERGFSPWKESKHRYLEKSDLFFFHGHHFLHLRYFVIIILYNQGDPLIPFFITLAKIVKLVVQV